MDKPPQPPREKDSCDICGRVLCSTRNLHRHRLSHRMHEHKCYICNKTFSRNDNMQKHVISVHIRRRLREFPCPVLNCENRSKSYQDALKHVDDHKEKAGNYAQCKQCFEGFQNLRKLLNHYLIEHDIASFNKGNGSKDKQNHADSLASEQLMSTLFGAQKSSTKLPNVEQVASNSDSSNLLNNFSELFNTVSAFSMIRTISGVQDVQNGFSPENLNERSAAEEKGKSNEPIQDFSSLLSFFSDAFVHPTTETPRTLAMSPAGLGDASCDPSKSTFSKSSENQLLKNALLGFNSSSTPAVKLHTVSPSSCSETVEKKSKSFTISSILSNVFPETSSDLTAALGLKKSGSTETSGKLDSALPTATSEPPLVCGTCKYVTEDMSDFVAHLVSTKHV